MAGLGLSFKNSGLDLDRKMWQSALLCCWPKTWQPGLPGWPFWGQRPNFRKFVPNNTCWPKNFCLALWLFFGLFPG